MKKEDKELVVAELAERLRTSDTLLVADYRGLTMPQIDALRTRLIESGARFSVVKNTLTRRAAEAAGVGRAPDLLEGPTAIAFLEADGDMVAAAKALNDMAKETKILAIRGGVLAGRTIDRGRGREPRDAPAARRAPRPGAGRDHRPAHRAAGPRHRAAPEPVRPDRRPHRAAGRRGRDARLRPRRRGCPRPRSPPPPSGGGGRGGDADGHRRHEPPTRTTAEPAERKRPRSKRRQQPRRSRQDLRAAREDDRPRARRAEEEDRGRVGHHRRRAGRGRGRRRRRRRAAEVEEQTAFDVVLTGTGHRRSR